MRNRPDFNAQALDEYLSYPNKYTHKVVPLGRDAIPFYVFYGTASFGDDGRLRFARDAYDLDSRILRALTPQDDSL
jgi:murein L,D-transpeptidase YcbB/YkuD